MNILLGIIDNKRPEYLDACINSLSEKIKYSFYKKIIIDDSGDINYSNRLNQLYSNDFHIISHQNNKGLSGSIRTLWDYSLINSVDYIFHVEGDFLFNKEIDISYMVKVFDYQKNLAQISLKRQPVNIDEINHGGFMEMNPESYEDKYIEQLNYNFTEHRNFFTLNPSLYPLWVVKLGWETGWGEKEFAERLFLNPEVKCGYFGKKIDEPLVHHIGHLRSDNWFV